MKNYFLAFILILTACASSSIRMSPEEKKKAARNVDRTALEMMAFKKKCLTKKLSVDIRRTNCVNFIHGPAAFITDVAVINSMCDLKGVVCKKNGEPWGQGTLEVSSKIYSDSIQFKNPNGSVDNYEITTYL